MSGGRVIMLGLDGFELSLAERMMAQGRLPALSRLEASGVRVLLDHGSAKRTGLAWEHVATGLSPDDAGRWAAVHFDPAAYEIRQPSSGLRPFTADLGVRTVVFDPPYFRLDQAPEALGMVNWGAHDPGVPTAARPAGLLREIEGRFGAYPARPWIYGFVWPSVERTKAMADALVRAVDVRADISEWLLAERLPDWDLAYVVISEYHSAIEALWHGIDETHPLHGEPSALPAKVGVEGVYERSDRLLGRLMERFPDARIVAFNLHGMGANDSDPASMALLAELLYRNAFGEPLLNGASPATIPPGRTWDDALGALLPPAMRRPRAMPRLRRLAARIAGGEEEASADWMPAARYRRYWPRMRAFALPAYYDGRVRINLKGREAMGLVEPGDYQAACREVEELLADCHDPRSGRPVVKTVERAAGDPMRLTPTEADLIVVWKDAPMGFDHPRLGRIGPLPYRRTGGHTGESGVAYLGGPGIAHASLGRRSAFDVAPTVVEMLGGDASGLSGASFLSEVRARAVEPA